MVNQPADDYYAMAREFVAGLRGHLRMMEEWQPEANQVFCLPTSPEVLDERRVCGKPATGLREEAALAAFACARFARRAGALLSSHRGLAAGRKNSRPSHSCVRKSSQSPITNFLV